jgi:branched-chain amino acid transport system substrate-binding protein
MNNYLAGAAVIFSLGLASAASAQDGAISDDHVKIGVLGDMSGVYSDVAGPGMSVAAQMAITDFDGTVLGKPIELVSANHQNKPDIGSAIARRWIDRDGVDMITGLENSAVGLAVQGLGTGKKIITINTGAGSTAFTEDACSEYGIHYTYDVYATGAATATAIVKEGGKKWFFITADYAFGHSVRDNTSAVVEDLGGTVVGGVDAPLSTNDFSSYLLQASNSGADVIGLANAGSDAINAIKQANEFGIVQRGQKLAGLLIYIADVKSLGLNTAQGLQFTTAFYWDRNDATREWSQRFHDKHGAMPTMIHAGTYSAVTNYLKAIKTAGNDDPDAVREQLGKMTINDFFAQNGKIEANGLMSHDMYLVEVKTPDSSEGEWDLMKIVRTIPAENAFIPLSESACPRLDQ